jgi:hypothetical protein
MRMADAFLLLGVPVLIAGLMVWAQLTPGNSPIGLAIGWSVPAAWLFFGILATIKKVKAKNMVKFVSKYGIAVGWNDPRFTVKEADFDAVVADTLLKMGAKYPEAAKALRGCLVVFHTTKYVQSSTGRWVAGEQDGPIIIVGWHLTLATTALQHELAHRVLQIFAGDPMESIAHAMMVELKVA